MMATWVTHFRIAEALISRDLPVSKIDFLVGNIGPDCGLIGEDGKPMPPKEITHFKMNHTVHLLCEIVSQRMNMGGLYV